MKDAAPELVARIDRCVELMARQSALEEELAAERAGVRELLKGAKLLRFSSPAGHQALLFEQEVADWHADKLERILGDEELDELVPRKPDAGKLKKRCESDAAFAKRVAKCASRSTRTALTIRPAKEKPTT